MSLTDDELRELYTARPDEFVRVRNELARALRKEGRRDDAGDLAARRRPSAIAWSLNRVAHERSPLVEAWHEAAVALRDAMQRAVKGDAEAVRGAQSAERRATDAIVNAARRQLDELGSKDSDTTASRIAGTLRAAALDDEVAQRLRTGTLETDVVASGFGFGEVSVDELRAVRAPRRTGAPSTADARVAGAARDQAQRDAAAARIRRAEVERMESAAARLTTAAEKAQRRVDDLRTQTEQLQERLRNAERNARRARNEAERAAAAAARARARADE